MKSRLLSPQWYALRARLPRLSIRPGRWLAWLRRLLLAALILISATSGLAVAANARIPQVDWQDTPIGLDVQALVDRDGTLYAVTTGGGMFRSGDDGASWEPVSNELAETGVLGLGLDERDGALYASTMGGGLFRSDDGGENWQVVSFPGPSSTYPQPNLSPLPANGESLQAPLWASPTYPLLNLLSTRHSYGIVVRGPERGPERRPDHEQGEHLVWAAYGGGDFGARLAAGLNLRQATIRPLPDGRAEVLTAQENTLSRAELPPGYRRLPLAWLALRAWLWRKGIPFATSLALALALTVTLGIVSTYANLTRPFGLPLWAALLARRRLETYARPSALEAAWPDWEQAIRAELLRYGDATVDDLRRTPGPFRYYALRRYAQTHDPVQALEARPGRVRLLTGDRQRRWYAAWTTAARSVGARAGITASGRRALDGLAAVLAEALGLTLDQPRDFEAVRARLVEAPALRLRLPPRFPLVFVADPQPGPGTVQMLVDAVAVLRETGYFALVVPLEPPARRLDVAAELRQAVARSPHVQDFIVLSRDDLLDILIARHPTQTLVQNILAQVDLTVVSPFVISGPVPETMFFGREAEVKMLVESAGSADFAIVGNRKIGKTSLLQRARARMAAGRRARPLMVDCQIVRDAASFFAAFQAQNKLALPEPTPEGLAATLTNLRQEGLPLVLLLDEVDELLADEQARGEPLVATWRALAQAGVCRFIFCGSTELARRLDDPDSAFFNFSQPLPLGYLSPETARLVLIQPLETLGITLGNENADRLLAEVQALTSGHPNLIQYLGRGLVEAANRRGERRILLDDLAALRYSTDFTEYYLKTVWGRAGTLERLITLLAPSDGFQIGELEAALAAQGVQVGVQVNEEELDTALKLLRTYAILEKHERTYTFIPRAFSEILHRTQEVERLIAIEKRRLAAGGI